MAFDDQALKDYIDVAERIAEFHLKYPGGSLQPLDPGEPFKIREMTGTSKDGKQFTATFIIYTAAAYRSDGDPRPGIGVAWEVFPGRTPYTLGSELMNAETSAWGRALAALGVATRKGIASRQEVEQAHDRQNGAAQARARNRPLDVPPQRLKRTPAKTTGTEQEQLRHGTVEATPDDRPADRGPIPPADDMWAGQPAGPPLKLPPPSNEPGSADGKQVKDISVQLSTLGVTDHEEQLARIERIINGPLDGPHTADDGTHRTRKNLSRAEAETVKQNLAEAIKTMKLAARAKAEQDAAAEATP
jgi:hypothetical protein